MSPWQFEDEQDPGPSTDGSDGSAVAFCVKTTTRAVRVKRCFAVLMNTVVFDSLFLPEFSGHPRRPS